MKNACTIVVALVSFFTVNAQNTFPSSGNVGIGTTNPSTLLHLNGKGGEPIAKTEDLQNKACFILSTTTPPNGLGTMTRLYAGVGSSEYTWLQAHNGYENGMVKNISLNPVGGNVGIGTTTPSAKLDVNGSLRVRGFALIHDGGDFILGNNDGRPKGKKESQRALVHAGNDHLVINYNGDFEGGVLFESNVGIGTTPVTGYGLAVSGKMITEEVLVQLKSTWPDFVFKKDYNLPSLKQVEKHIQEKGHLANIPSAKEVAKNGVKLGEMNKKLLQKIEELTLYTIAQEKQLKKEEERNKRQESRLEKQDKENKQLLSLVKSLSKRIEKLEKN